MADHKSYTCPVALEREREAYEAREAAWAAEQAAKDAAQAERDGERAELAENPLAGFDLLQGSTDERIANALEDIAHALTQIHHIMDQWPVAGR